MVLRLAYLTIANAIEMASRLLEPAIFLASSLFVGGSNAEVGVEARMVARPWATPAGFTPFTSELASPPVDDDAVQWGVEGEDAGLLLDRRCVETLDAEGRFATAVVAVPGADRLGDLGGQLVTAGSVADDAELSELAAPSRSAPSPSKIILAQSGRPIHGAASPKLHSGPAR